MKLFRKIAIKKIKDLVKNIGIILSKLIDDILLIIGIILLATGVFKIFVPAGYIVLGICFIAFAFFIAKSRVGRK